MPVTWKRNTRTLERHHEITGLPHRHSRVLRRLRAIAGCGGGGSTSARRSRSPTRAARSPTCCARSAIGDRAPLGRGPGLLRGRRPAASAGRQPATAVRLRPAPLRSRAPLRRPQFLRVGLAAALRAGLDLYSQVLLKIESHYVDVPRWKDLVDRGTGRSGRGVGRADVRRRNAAPAEYRLAIDAFRRELPADDGLADGRDARSTPARPWRRPPGWPSSGWALRPRPSCSNISAAPPTRWTRIPPTSRPTNSTKSTPRSKGTSSAWAWN